VLVAIALAVAGVLIFGSGKLLRDLEKYVLYFEGSVKGLNVGAPLMFRGVKVGSVTDIMLQYNPEDLTVYIPVVIEVERDRFESVSGKKRRKAPIGELINRGLRAQLQLQSLVTGMLMVDLDFYTDEPLKMVRQENARYPEIPTIISDLQKLTKTIEQLPLDEIINKLAKSLDGIEKIVNSPELQGSIVSLKKALDSADSLLVHIDKKVDPLLANIEDTSNAARGTFVKAEKTLEDASGAFVQAEKTLALEEGVPGELASNLKAALASAQNSLNQAEQTLETYQGLGSEDSALVYEVTNAMKELSSAVRSVRFLADYLERHPEAVLRGKGSPKGD
jgi:paraquat-inducible protein B